MADQQYPTGPSTLPHWYGRTELPALKMVTGKGLVLLRDLPGEGLSSSVADANYIWRKLGHGESILRKANPKLSITIFGMPWGKGNISHEISERIKLRSPHIFLSRPFSVKETIERLKKLKRDPWERIDPSSSL